MIFTSGMYHSKAVSSLSELDIKYPTDTKKVSTMRKNGVLKLKSKIRVSDMVRKKRCAGCWNLLKEKMEKDTNTGLIRIHTKILPIFSYLNRCHRSDMEIKIWTGVVRNVRGGS